METVGMAAIEAICPICGAGLLVSALLYDGGWKYYWREIKHGDIGAYWGKHGHQPKGAT